MSFGTLTLMLGLLGPAAGDVPAHMKDRSISIPYSLSVSPNEVNEVILYVSIDRGRVWSRAGVIKPTERSFPYQAPTDGEYWFNVAVVYKNNTQVPADVSQAPVQQKVVFDTQKPGVRVISADRIGEDVVVSWEVQEANPDFTTMKLEYRPTDAAAGNFGYAVPLNAGLSGQTRFRPNTPAPITVKLALMDQAGNLGWSERAVGIVTPTAGINQVPLPPVSPPIMPEPVPAAVAPIPPPAAAPVTPEPLVPMPLASSQRVEPVRNVVQPYTAMRQETMNVFHTNEPQVTIDYEIEKKGPSGVSKIEVYVTQDDGKTWQKWQDLTYNDGGKADLPPGNSLPVTVRLPDREGVFGFRLVPFSGSQLSAGPPQSGEAPEIRVQFDRTLPIVELLQPIADSRDANALVLHWTVSDANLAPQPIQILWSEQPSGDWKPVTSGRIDGVDASMPKYPTARKHTWNLPPGLPLRIYLKIVAVDQAGNIGEAATAQPIIVDLHKPVGRVKGLVPKPRG